MLACCKNSSKEKWLLQKLLYFMFIRINIINIQTSSEIKLKSSYIMLTCYYAFKIINNKIQYTKKTYVCVCILVYNVCIFCSLENVVVFNVQ